MSEDNTESAAQIPPKKTGIARLLAATGYSYAGLKAAFSHEEAFRIELVAFCVLAPLGVWLGESRLDQVTLVGVLVLVLTVAYSNNSFIFFANKRYA